jgi:hypothetical protein
MTETILLKRDIKILKEQQQESISLFKNLSKQVGTHYGELIDEHLVSLQGRRHNPLNWDLQDRNGDQ